MKSKKENKRSFKSLIKAILLGSACLVLAFLVFIAIKIISLDAWWTFDPEKILNVDQTTIVYDSDGIEYTRLYSGENRVWVQIESLPASVIAAFISAEDARYYDHPGIDIIRIFGALWEDIKAGGYVQGASTITQQLIKLSHLSSEKTISRKLEEVIMAYKLEKQFSKDEILEMYLNYVYFGRGYYGIEAAAWGYFGVHSSDLNINQAATLAGILKAPANYSPHLAPEASLNRRNLILSLMKEYGYIAQGEYSAAIAEPLSIIQAEKYSRGYYVDAVLSEASAVLDLTSSEVLSGGYQIYSCVDRDLQEYIEKIFLDENLFPDIKCSGAAVVVRNNTFSVAAIVGGKETDDALAYNRAIDIRRQPGSVIKPIIVYGPALESGKYTAASLMLDERTDFSGYSPRNFGDKYYGWITLREAVKKSLNIPAVKLMADLGVEYCKGFASDVGIGFQNEDTSLTLALGGFLYGVSPLQIAGAYNAFASGGLYEEPYMIEKIVDSDGSIVYTHESDIRRVMEEENAYILTSMLQSVIDEGTGKRLGEFDFEIAGKTGTVGTENGNRDAWMAAYDSNYSMCVWMGYDSDNLGIMPDEASGGNYPAKILARLFAFTSERNMPAPFEVPNGVIEVEIDEHTLKNENRIVAANAFTPSSDTIKEVFKRGTEPSETTSYWTVPKSVGHISVDINENGAAEISFIAESKETVYKLYRTSFDGRKQLISQWENTKGLVTFTDNVELSGKYAYCVLPEHPELMINGIKMTGAVTWSKWLNIYSNNNINNNDTLELEDTEF